jgi:hypothetical protein
MESKIMEKYKIYIKQNSTGIIRIEHYETDSESGTWYWEEGNAACDCNRSLQFDRAAGLEADWEKAVCGMSAYSIKIENEDGKVTYIEDEFNEPVPFNLKLVNEVPSFPTMFDILNVRLDRGENND